MPPDRQPTPDQLLAMTYADGEMGAEDSREFEARLATEPELAKDVAQHLSLSVMARRVAPPEPMDYEWRRLALDPIQRASHGLAWLLLSAGAIGLTLWGMVEIMVSRLAPLPKSLVLALLVGSIVLLIATVRARLRTLPFDRYTGVER